MRLLPWFLMVLGPFVASFSLWAWMPFVSRDMRLDLVGAVFMLVMGTLIYFGGSWLDKKLPPLPKEKTYVLKSNDISFITNMLTKARRGYLIFGLFLLAFDVLIVYAVTHGNESEPAHPVIVKVIGITAVLFLLAVAGAFLYKSFTLRNIYRTPLYKALTKTPHLVTDLSVVFIQNEDAPGKTGRQILAELTIESEKLRILVSEEQHSLLRQYIQLHSPQVRYHEKAQGC